MPTNIKIINKELKTNPKVWLITGVAGFIGSNLLEALLKLDQYVVGLDNLSTGYPENLDDVKSGLSTEQWNRFDFHNGDICDESICKDLVKGVDHILHQAALGSVPRSINDPRKTNQANVTGFLNMLFAAKEEQVGSFTFASSSSVYGDDKGLPKVEDKIGQPLSPYSLTKYTNELYADVFEKNYKFKTIGLRYFNVFGKRQDPNGAYAAVIPRWVKAMIKNDDVSINGDGKNSRDFCFIENVVQMNLLASQASESEKSNIYNVSYGDRTTLNELFNILKGSLLENGIEYSKDPIYGESRIGDVKHSQANISKAKRLLNYDPEFSIKEGIYETLPWYIKKYS